jgi:plasmid replication initiation protein
MAEMEINATLNITETCGLDTSKYLPDARLVSMSNALIRAGHGLTLSEKRLVSAAASELNRNRQTLSGECPVVKLTATEYAVTFGVDTDTAYDQLQSGAKALYGRSICFHQPSYRRNGTPCVVTHTMRWVGEAIYHQKEGWIELHFWHAVVPHLIGLRKQFTIYQLEQASALRSIYSWRLLELLMRFQFTGWAEYTIEDFCVSMDATPKQREDFAAIRRKIIEPAVRELIQKDGWLIKWETIKAGRKVTAVRFTFSRNPQRQLSL